MICDHCTHVRYSRDGGSTYCGRSGKYKNICRFNPNLETCPVCGGKVKVGHACDEYFITPRIKTEGCYFCKGGFPERRKNKGDVAIAWNRMAEYRKRGIRPPV